jgi:hypothetical protein
MTANDDRADWDAAYVLGALTPEESAEYERFLSRDPAHTAALQEVSDIPAILDILSPDEALALLDGPTDARTPPPVSALADVVEKRRQRSRRARLATAFASAAACLIIGGFVGYAVLPRPSAPGVALQAMGAGQREGVTASLAVTPEQWGTRLDWECEYTKNWATSVSRYDLVVTTSNGAESVVASWAPTGEETSNLAAATVIPASEIRTIAIREAGTTTPLAVSTFS